ncbi:MAG TPA: sugar ABC transporter permease [Devosia sp.]|uniref:carbohydrate ABC transporter permease n=1 Tax=Devosia sp. TaxID=1871048 RepID=UPI002DDD58AE|nr:sugar ABC transporter permease [Devosia sp.]HEV2518254.1 sugar ABC transporter permease [Devosia sp.]
MTTITASERALSEGQLKSRANRRRLLSKLPAIIGTIPMMIVAIGVFVIGIGFTIVLSFTNVKFFLINIDFVGLKQYDILWSTARWVESVKHIWFYGFGHIALCLVGGFLLAVFMDQRIKAEDAFRTIFLYPFALSAVITGLVWQLMLDPIWGLQAYVRSLGFSDFTFAPLADGNTALLGMIVASSWNGVGVTMAILLAGLRGVDEEIWKAARIDGIPTWRTYISIVIPMMRGAVATALVLLVVNVVRTFDIVIAMTGGGPGISTQMPATYVIDSINSRNVGQGMAAATIMLLPIAMLILIQFFFRWRASLKGRTT